MKNKDNKKLIIIIAIGVFLIISLLIILFSINNSDSQEELTPDEQAAIYGTTQKETYPILSYLPITTAVIQIGYTYPSSSSTVPIITINTATPYLDSAVKKLISLANSTSQPIYYYDVEVNNFKNSFSSYASSSATDPNTFIKESFSSVRSLNIKKGTFSENDNYYYGTITSGSEENYTLVTYRFILERNNTSWRFVSTPYPILTTKNTPNISEDILETVNNF